MLFLKAKNLLSVKKGKFRLANLSDSVCKIIEIARNDSPEEG